MAKKMEDIVLDLLTAWTMFKKNHDLTDPKLKWELYR